ncbi:mechanosensitive ion channel family protein [Rubritalea tangerina]|uniref:Mechanosensitive ion channel family protein n=1 Tax=Rubritalea tangerina TaxID=430798 RepID=A0ABW4ZAU8_9BACT
MKVIHQLFILGTLLVPSLGAEESKPVKQAVIVEEVVDPNSLHYVLSADARGVELPSSELRMMLRPLTKEELGVELEEWMALLKKLITDASRVNLEIARMEAEELESAEGLKLREEQLNYRRDELVLVKHINTVIHAYEQKGGNVDLERKYVAAVVETKDATTKSPSEQVTALAADFGVWFDSREGGKEFIKKTTRFVIILFFFAGFGKLIASVTRRIMRRHHRGSRMLREFIEKTIGFVVFVIGFFVALAAVGVHVGSMLTALGAGGVVIGFALQDSIVNFWSGLMIMIYKPFDVDDFVLIDGVKGKVERMSFVSTTLVTIDNKELVIPNRKAWGNTITNYTGRSVRRIDFNFSISHDDDIEKAGELLIELAKGHEKVLGKPEPVFGVNGLTDISVDLFFRPWVKTEDYWPVYWELNKQIKAAFDREGITIPKPQQELTLHQGAT